MGSAYNRRLLEEVGVWSFYIFILLLITFRALDVQFLPYLGGSVYAAENETIETLCPQDGTCTTFQSSYIPVGEDSVKSFDLRCF